MGICLSNLSKSDQGDSSVPPIRLVPLVTPTLKCFKLTYLRKATQNFKTDSQLGEYVYKGWIDNQSFKPSRPGAGVAVFVKHHRGFDDEDEWIDKLNFLGNIHHPNIMRLIGYCSEGDERLFVSEYMIEGNLEKHLFEPNNNRRLSWSLRFKIVLGVAKGLAFLHSALVGGTYDADFSPSKVLLDFDHNPKLYGFRRQPNDDDDNEQHCRVLGSYIDPIYQLTGSGTLPQCDVYSYGLVLLEVVLGRRVALKEKAEWHKGIQLDQLMDTGLEGKYPLDDARAMAKLAVRCLNKKPRSRPSMEEVVVELEALQKNASSSIIQLMD